jgi:cyclic pyranopterin phosphate synthase
LDEISERRIGAERAIAGRPTHIRADGGLTMVDVAAKAATDRFARARALVRMSTSSADALRAAALPKGDAFVAAQLAGIMAAKQTATLIPLAHPLPLAHVEVEFGWDEPGLLRIEASARTTAQTGVEMEAMTAAAVAALTIYDMTKALERGISIESVRLVEKRGGKSGTWLADGAP